MRQIIRTIGLVIVGLTALVVSLTVLFFSAFIGMLVNLASIGLPFMFALFMVLRSWFAYRRDKRKKGK